MTVEHRAPWHAKAAICLECRTVVEDGANCGEDSHHTTDLDSVRGRERLIHARWHRDIDAVPVLSLGRMLPPDPRALGLALPSALLVAAVALLVAAIAHAGSLTTAALMIGFAVVSPLGILGMLRRSGRPLAEARPLGAVAPTGLLPAGEPVLGEVVAGRSAPAPLSGRPCLAYAIGLHHTAARPSTLVAQEASCQSFKVRTDDGDFIDIPAGTLILDGNRDVVDGDDDRVRGYLERLRLTGERGERLLDFDEVRELRLCLGDRIAIHGDLRPELDPNGEPATYREPPAQHFVPVGTPVIERLSPTRH